MRRFYLAYNDGAQALMCVWLSKALESWRPGYGYGMLDDDDEM